MRRIWLICLAVFLAFVGGGRDGFDRWIDATVLPPLQVETGVEVRDRAGVLLRAYTVADGKWRLKVARAQVDQGYLAMLVAYEDKRFFNHGGIDPVAVLRAGWQAVTTGRIVSGASTLTMQVARLLEHSGTGEFAGKLRQMRVALALERRLGKPEILDLYLALAPFGGNIEGVRAASLAWFAKEPARLSAAEAALLVALPQSPQARRPDRIGTQARDARGRVLMRMYAAGVLDADTAQAATQAPLPVVRHRFPTVAAHLSDRLRRMKPLQRVHVTTLDRGLQIALEGLAHRVARGAGAQVSAAIMVVDHRTGDVLASVGSAGYAAAQGRQGFVDMTRALRSPGSTLKSLVYGLAFDQGLAHPETLIDDRPTAFGSYVPVNFDGLYRGTLRVRDALQMSLNVPVVSLTQALGPARLMAGLRRAGVQPRLPGSGAPGLAVALGGVGVTLEDLMRLYGMLGNNGRAIGLNYDAAGSKATPELSVGVLSPVAAWQVGNILAGITPPQHAPRIPLAYKTGTSYGHRDAWAIGFDAQHVIGVWMGRADGTPVPGAFGGQLAAPVLFEAFGRLKAQPVALPPPPAATLLVPNAELPLPLRRFGTRAAQQDATGPKLAFPPDGAELEYSGALLVKVRDGVAPFTWLANGALVVAQARRRDAVLPDQGKGFVELVVIDATGQTAKGTVFIR
jgi:penicillin-binding protein 1C